MTGAKVPDMPSTDAHDDTGRGTTAPTPEYLSTGQAASLLRVSVSTLQRWDREGRFTAQRTPLTNQRRYRHADVLALLDTTAA